MSSVSLNSQEKETVESAIRLIMGGSEGIKKTDRFFEWVNMDIDVPKSEVYELCAYTGDDYYQLDNATLEEGYFLDENSEDPLPIAVEDEQALIKGLKNIDTVFNLSEFGVNIDITKSGKIIAVQIVTPDEMRVF